MIVDLHTHTRCSDGSLAPDELLSDAQAARVDILAVTDHDTTAAYRELLRTPIAGLKLIPGIEFSTESDGYGIHVLGLNIDTECDAMRAAVGFQSAARAERAEQIAQRLDKLGIENALSGAQAKAGSGAIGRPHFAQYMVDIGFVKSLEQAFKRYLGPGKLGDVKQMWASLPQIIEWIRDSKGTAVLAHPAKYKMTRSRRQRLIGTFAASGGQGLEVVSGRQDPELSASLAGEAATHGLAASLGSDFHHRNQPWASLGMPLRLPPNCRPIWDEW